MKRLTVLMWGMLVFIWSMNAQDTTKMNIGGEGEVTVVNKGTSTVITIDAENLEKVMETVASELIESMGIVLDELSKTMDELSVELETTMTEQRKIETKERQLDLQKQQSSRDEDIQEMKASIERHKKELKEQQIAMQQSMKEAEMEYRQQLEQMKQYKMVKEVYLKNREELDKINGRVTIEINEPVLRSSSITQKQNEDTTEVKIVGKSVIKVIDRGNESELSVGGYDNIYISDKGGDTVEVRLGNKVMKITDSDSDSKIEIEDRVYKAENEKNGRKGKFKGHWSFIELGMNTFTTPDYGLYSGTDFTPSNEFLELNYNKSTEFNINPFHVSLGIINGKNRHSAKLGIVSGLGFNFNNYTFDNNITLTKTDNRLTPVDLALENGITAKKSKLTTTYLTVPLMLEFTLPGGDAFISAGAIGALKLGSHTKYKTDSKKEKERGDFYLNPFRYGFTARIGYKSLSLYGTYYVSDMFQENKGPVATPFSIGIGLL